MSVLDRVWNYIWDGLSHFFSDDVVPALKDWAAQFKGDVEQVVLQDAAQYGPLVLNGSMSMVDAIDKLGQDLLAKGIEVSKDLIANAIRTWTNSAAMQTSVSPASSTADTPAAPASPPVVS